MPAATEDIHAVRTPKPMQFVAPKRARKAAQETKRYWLGSMPDSPRQNFALDSGGEAIEFPRYSGHFTIDEFGQVQGNPQRGAFRDLTDDQAANLLKSAANYVVRKAERPKETGPIGPNGEALERSFVGDVLDVRGGDPKTAPHDEKGNAVLTYRAPPASQPDDEPMGRYLYLYPIEPGVALPENPEPMVARS